MALFYLTPEGGMDALLLLINDTVGLKDCLCFFGPGAEVVSRLVEKSFWYLEAPVKRVTGYDVIVPFPAYEQYYLPNADRVLRAAREALDA